MKKFISNEARDRLIAENRDASDGSTQSLSELTRTRSMPKSGIELANELVRMPVIEAAIGSALRASIANFIEGV